MLILCVREKRKMYKRINKADAANGSLSKYDQSEYNCEPMDSCEGSAILRNDDNARKEALREEQHNKELLAAKEANKQQEIVLAKMHKDQLDAKQFMETQAKQMRQMLAEQARQNAEHAKQMKAVQSALECEFNKYRI
jgi:hypothetical protein